MPRGYLNRYRSKIFVKTNRERKREEDIAKENILDFPDTDSLTND